MYVVLQLLTIYFLFLMFSLAIFARVGFSLAEAIKDYLIVCMAIMVLKVDTCY